MGNSSSSSHSATNGNGSSKRSNGEILVDGGHLEPQSHLFASSDQEFNKAVVEKLILERRLAPFYLGLNDEPEGSLEDVVLSIKDADATATKNLKDALAGFELALSEAETAIANVPGSTAKRSKEGVAAALIESNRDRLTEVLKARSKRDVALMTSHTQEIAKLYLSGSIECPICFLYYPPPLVHTRCCDQPICTECFVQIKRADVTATHLESEPASCPYCMESDFGCIYQMKDDSRPAMPALSQVGSTSSETPSTSSVKQKPRRKSFAHTEKHVVTTDQIHPDWQSKVDAIRATVARRANRRIVFRQVGDRLIPVGITSGRSSDGSNATMSAASLPPGFASQMAAMFNQSTPDAAAPLSAREARRAARRRNEEMVSFLSGMGVGVGPELEEMMVLEAIRLSMIEDEERKNRTAAEQGANEPAAGTGNDTPETSAQGAARSTSDMLSEAMDEPLQRQRPSLSIPAPAPPSSSPSASSATASDLPPSLIPLVAPESTAPTVPSVAASLPSHTTLTDLTSDSAPNPSPS